MTPPASAEPTGIRLLGRSSSINVRKVLWTMAELDQPFVHETGWATPEASASSPEILRLNPNGLVPVLIDGDDVLWESNTICRYLAARHRRYDLLPADPLDRAEVEKWMDWQATELNAAWSYAFMALVRRHPDFVDPAGIARSTKVWNARMTLLDRRLEQTGAYVTGAGFALADIGLGLSINRWRHTPIDRPNLPALDTYAARLLDRSGAAAWMTASLP